MKTPRPPLYDILYGNFAGRPNLNTVSETGQVILSMLDNIQRIFNCRAGTLAYSPDYGLPDMTAILQGVPMSAYQLMSTLSAVLLGYGPHLQRITVVMFDQHAPGESRYAIDVELKDAGLVRYGTEFMSEGRVLICHLKRRQYFDARSAL